MMATVSIPPFELFYEEQKHDVLARLRRLLGPQEAEDAFQETFLRALRAYASLRHADYLRAWVLTIAANVATDMLRRRRPTGELPEQVTSDAAPAYAQLEALTFDLPPKERAAIVLRYGYDLPYADIGAALGQSEDAARQAASSGVRRLRRKELR
jgi:RNA polymerase sigma factor (sigma-70 family)